MSPSKRRFATIIYETYIFCIHSSGPCSVTLLKIHHNSLVEQLQELSIFMELFYNSIQYNMVLDSDLV